MAVLFDETIRNLRKSKKMTQDELAKKIGVARPMISAYENGTKQPSHETLMRIAHTFGVSMDYLYGFQMGQRAREYVDVTGLERRYRILIEELVEGIRRT